MTDLPTKKPAAERVSNIAQMLELYALEAERAAERDGDRLALAQLLRDVRLMALNARTAPIVFDEVMLWCLYDPRRPEMQGVPQVSEGYMAAMLGVDRLDLRAAYEDFLTRHGAESAIDVRVRQVRERLAGRRGE
jgi:hypothetical protein